MVFSNKKGLFGGGAGMGGMSKPLNIIVGLVALAAGGATAASSFGMFTLPAIPEIVILIACTLGGFILLLDGLMGVQTMSGSGFLKKGMVMFIGIFVLAAGLLPLLGQFNVLSVPAIPIIGIAIICAVGGLILIMNGLLGTKMM